MAELVKPVFFVMGWDPCGWQMELIVDQRLVGLFNKSPPKTSELEKGSGGFGGSLRTRLRAAFIE